MILQQFSGNVNWYGKGQYNRDHNPSLSDRQDSLEVYPDTSDANTPSNAVCRRNQVLNTVSENQIQDLPVEALLNSMADALQAMLIDQPLVVAICSGGVWVAEALHQRLAINDPLGLLDISFYRDDFSQVGLHPKVGSSALPVSVDNRHIILIDDILHTGRTVRAALNELFAWGRPASVVLAVLIDRGKRELPMQADIIGLSLALENNQFVKISPDGRLHCVDRQTNGE